MQGLVFANRYREIEQDRAARSPPDGVGRIASFLRNRGRLVGNHKISA